MNAGAAHLPRELVPPEGKEVHLAWLRRQHPRHRVDSAPHRRRGEHRRQVAHRPAARGGLNQHRWHRRQLEGPLRPAQGLLARGRQGDSRLG